MSRFTLAEKVNIVLTIVLMLVALAGAVIAGYYGVTQR